MTEVQSGETTQPDHSDAMQEKVQPPRRLTGAARGTAVHNILERIDYRKWTDPSKVTKEEFDRWVQQLLSAGEVPEEYASVLQPYVFLPFLHSRTAIRMAAADAAGHLRREQPFVLGVPAKSVKAEFPESETVLIQGIIDAFFLEEDHIVVVDYKTDYVQKPEELSDRYRIQLEYYAMALERMLKKPVTERIIYSFALQREIRV